MALANLRPLARQRIKDALDTEKNPDDARLAFEAGRWVIEMHEGRPKQQVALSGELTITDQLRGLSEADLAALLALVQKAPDSAARPEEK